MRSPYEMINLKLTTFIFLLVFTTSCGGGAAHLENTDMVETGIYEVIVSEVDSENRAIFVQTEEGKVLGLQFSEVTQLTQSDQTVDFDALRPGQTLQVKLRNKDTYLEPLEVKIVG